MMVLGPRYARTRASVARKGHNMLPTTQDALRAVLKADPSLTPTDRNRILASVRNHGREETAQPEKQGNRILRRSEVAQRFGRSKRFVDKLAREGVLTKLTLPGRTRAVGFKSEDVDRLFIGGGEGLT